MHRGTLKKGDKVEIVGYGRENVKSVISGYFLNFLKDLYILGLESFKKTVDQAFPGDQLGILLKGLGPKDIRRGCCVLPATHKHNISDKVKAQVKNLKNLFLIISFLDLCIKTGRRRIKIAYR